MGCMTNYPERGFVLGTGPVAAAHERHSTGAPTAIACHKRIVEAEHREILVAALAGPRRRSFTEVLAQIPNVGCDKDSEGTANTTASSS